MKNQCQQTSKLSNSSIKWVRRRSLQPWMHTMPRHFRRRLQNQVFFHPPFLRVDLTHSFQEETSAHHMNRELHHRWSSPQTLPIASSHLSPRIITNNLGGRRSRSAFSMSTWQTPKEPDLKMNYLTLTTPLSKGVYRSSSDAHTSKRGQK